MDITTGEIYDVHDESELVAAMEAAEDGVVILPRFIPWANIITRFPTVTHVIFPYPNGTWDCQKIKGMDKFPVSWRGKGDGELSSVSGIPGGVYCHPSGYSSVWTTKASAIMATVS